MKQYWFLSMLFVFSVSCSREKSATTNIVFEIPAAQQKASSDFNLLDLQEIEDDFKTNNEWSSIVPTGITEGEYPINCYVVMVSGPEAHMQESMCGRKVVTASGTTASTGDVINPLFQFGPWVGAVYAGSGQSAQIAMDIPSGSSRVFRLIGFHALTAAACANFKSNVIDSGNLTKPYVLGAVGGINLAPGETSTVTIPQNLNADEWFDSCKFKDVNNDPIAPQVEMIGVAKVSGQAERAVFTLGTDSPNNLIYKCELYKFYPMNRYFQSTAMDQDVTMTSHTCSNEGAEPICNLDAPVAMFDDYSQCVAAVNIGQSSLYWTQNSPYIYRWIRTRKYGLNSNLDRNHNMYIQARAISSTGLEFKRANPIKYLIRRNDDTHVKLFGSRSLISGGCYKMTAVYAQYNGTVQTGGILDGIDLFVDNASGQVNIAANHIYSDSACSNLSIPTSITSGYVDFYIKAPSEPKFTLKVRMNGSHLADNAESVITSRLGSNFAKYARIRGPHVMLRNACVGPFTLESVNENGSSLVVTAASSSPFKMANTSMLSAYPASDCISGEIDLYTTGLSIPGGSSELKFYLKSNATPAVYDLKLTNSSGISTETRDMLLYQP